MRLTRAGLLISANAPVRAAESSEGTGYTYYTVRIFSGAVGALQSGAVSINSETAKIKMGDAVSVGGEEIAIASDDEEVSYSGGAVNGVSVITVTGLSLRDKVNVYPQSSVLSDKKYYVKGIRLSGRDNSEKLDNTSITVTGDADYVVAYGILSDAVEYTVRYVDEDGNTLRSPDIFYGNVGDKPVVAYVFISGYEPQSNNLTKTLSKNAEENVFTFVYSRVSSSEEDEDEGGTTTIIENVVEETIEETGGAVDVGAAGAGAGNADVAGGEAAQEIGGEEAPRELIDLDDEDAPLAQQVLENLSEIGARLLKLPFAVKLLTVVVAVALIAFIWLGSRRRKREAE